MVVFPAASAVISLACALVVAWDGWRRPKPDKVAWGIAFALFAASAGAEVVGALAGWTPALVRAYYLTGAVLVVGYLAVGELYLLAPRRMAAVGPGATLLVTAVAVAVVRDAPVDRARLASDGWKALEPGGTLLALTIGINSLGTVVVVGGALWSAWRFWKRRVQRHRAIGCVLIAVGTLLVASGGTLTRFGHREYLYIAMAAGVAIIFAGYLEARRSDVARAGDVARGRVPAGAGVATATNGTVGHSATGGGGLVPLTAVMNGRRGDETGGRDPAVAFLEERFLPLDDAALAEAGRVWSVERVVVDRFGRAEARRVWALRLRLSTEGQVAFDAHGVAARLQLTELYHEVLAPGVAELVAAVLAGEEGPKGLG